MIYLDNGATSFPKPRSVASSVYDAILNLGANPGRGGHRMSRLASEKVFLCRENLAKLFHIKDPERIVFTSNATQGINMALKGLLRKGDGLVTTSMEHNAVLRPAHSLEKMGVEVAIAWAGPDGIVAPAYIEAAITPRTRLICVTHASNVCGAINDLAAIGEIAKRRGVLFMVDAAQSAGCVEIDVGKMGIDILAFPGHKSLLGPQGTGGLYIGKNVSLAPFIEGGTGTQSESLVQPENLPERFESGTVNTPGILGLNAGVEYILNRTTADIFAHEWALTKMLTDDLCTISGLTVLGTEDIDKKTGIVSVKFEKADCVEVAQALDKTYNIAARAGLHCAPLAHKTLGSFESGALRFGIGPFNTKNDVKTAVWALSRTLRA